MQRIIDEVAELDLLCALPSESRTPVKLDQPSVGRLSRIDAMQRQAMSIAHDARRQKRHIILKAARKRIEIGDYGYCHSCDEITGSQRLAIDPPVKLCVSCAHLGG